jgi:hypothetical protein
MERWLVQSKNQAEFFSKFVLAEAEAGRDRLYSLVKANRSNKQNATLHLLFRRMAKGLNSAGYEIPHPFKPDLEIPWSEHSVKELLYRPIITSYFKVERSSDLDVSQFSESMEILVDAVNRNTGVYTPVPQEPVNAPS